MTFWFFYWNIVGIFILAILIGSAKTGPLYMADGLEFVNPKHIYKYSGVNWYGAVMMAIFYSAFCPIATLCYWFYKLCTIGRKE